MGVEVPVSGGGFIATPDPWRTREASVHEPLVYCYSRLRLLRKVNVLVQTKHSKWRRIGLWSFLGGALLLVAILSVERLFPSNRTACYGLTDRDVLDSIQRAYSDHGQMTSEMARDTRVDRARVMGVERFGDKGDDAFVGLLFRQDSGAFFSVRLFEDCTYQASPADETDLRNWAYPIAKPQF